MSDIVIVGGSFAGLAAALELRKRLPGSPITLVSPNDKFIFMPSLIWVMQGWRDPADLTFPIQPMLDEARITFKQTRLEQIAPDDHLITLSGGETVEYLRLVIATGGEWAWDRIPGSRPRPDGNMTSILSVGDAVNAKEDWQAFLADPGPLVIGLALGAGLYGAAYELALNLDVALRQAGKREQASITFVTPEPYLGHFGLGGIGNSRALLEAAFAHRGILYATEKQIRQVEIDRLVAAPSQHFESKMTMLIPSYRGIGPVRDTPGLADEDGLIPVDDFQCSIGDPHIYAAGTAARIGAHPSTLLPLQPFMPGTVSAEMGRIAAANIAADMGHGDPLFRDPEGLNAFYVLDSGGEGLLMSLGAESWLNLQMRVPGPWGHWAKSVAERYQMWQLQTGRY